MVMSLVDLHRALDNDEMVPHFQPLVELRTGRLSGFEVLARWNHPINGAFLPENLIALAEQNGLIGILSQQVFGKAFSAVRLLPGALRLSINLSPVQLHYATLSRQIQDLAAGFDFPLERLTAEITESALLKDLKRSQNIAGELKEMGCRLSLDDFGTGYSSLAHLQALPFDELKIDRSFVRQMTKRRESRKIVAAIVGLGHSLGLSTVAEGIETDEQSDVLLWLGSELGQGWHFGRPAPFEAICAIAAKAPWPTAHGLVSPGNDWAVSSLEAFPTQRLAQLQAIYDGAPVGLCFLDCALRYVSLNRRLAEMNGASVSSHLGKTVQEMVPELYQNVEPYLRRAVKGEAISGVEFPRPRLEGGKDGWILCSYQPAFDEADEVIGISISVMDVTEHRQAKEELRENEFVERNLGEMNTQSPWMTDAEGRNLEMSSQWVRTRPAGQATTRDLGWLEALHMDDLKPTIKRMKKALRTGEPIDIQYRVQSVDGEWRWMRSRGTPRFGAQGEITRWYGSVEDIQEQKSAETELRETKAKMRVLLKAVPVVLISDGTNRQVVTIEASAEDRGDGPRGLLKRVKSKELPGAAAVGN
jgi:PAS domain S-box-containing protein